MHNKISGRSGKLIKDVGIYAIGNLGAKLFTFILVPLYTHYIDPADYGYYDLCLTGVLLLMPILSMMLREGAFRFLLEVDEETRKKSIVTFVYKVLARNSVFAIIGAIFISFFTTINYLGLTVGLLIVMSVYEVVIQVVRGLGYTKYFVVAGVLSSLFIGLLSILFVVIFKFGIEGIFYANILARVIALLYLEFKLKIFKKYFSYKFNDKAINRELLKYCLPLLPGTICWWLVGSSNKLFIEHFLGLQENGLYAVALKFTSILETFAFIFYQAWQETAIRQYESKDRDAFFSNIMNNYIFVLSIGVVLFSFGLKLNYFWLVSESYNSSVNYIYPMAVSAMLFSLSAFFDMGYQCSKKTIYVLPGILLASIVNVVSNYYLIKSFGIYGIIASSILTFGFLYVYRIFDTRKFFKISFLKQTVISTIFILVSGVIYYISWSFYMDIAYIVIVILYVVIMAPDDLKNMMRIKSGIR